MYPNHEAFYVVTGTGDKAYKETPDYRGVQYGPDLVRLFMDQVEADRYLSVLSDYSDEQMQVQALTLDQIHKLSNGCQLEVSIMNHDEWPKGIYRIVETQLSLH